MKQIVLSFLLMFLPLMVSADNKEIDGIWYNLIPKGKVAEVIPSQSSSYSGEIVIPEKVIYKGVECNVTSIKYQSFKYCHNITSVTIPNSVTSIESEAFYNCSRLTSISIGNSVKSIGNDAFHACSSLASVNITDLEAWYNIDFYNSYSNPIFYAKKLLVNHSEIKELNIPNNLTRIHKLSFVNCTSLTSITIPTSIESIGQGSFSGCSGLTSIAIPNSVTSIGESAFAGCSGLTSIIIGSGLQKYGSLAFAYCPELTEVTLLAESITESYANAFDGSLIEYATLYLPAANYELYKDRLPWKNFQNIEVIPDNKKQKCATPIVSYKDGELSFSCDTEGVEFSSDISISDVKSHYGNKITISNIYKVTVYATKPGYYDSDKAILEFTFSGKLGDVDGNGIVNVADHVKLSEMIMNQQ